MKIKKMKGQKIEKNREAKHTMNKRRKEEIKVGRIENRERQREEDKMIKKFL